VGARDVAVWLIAARREDGEARPGSRPARLAKGRS